MERVEIDAPKYSDKTEYLINGIGFGIAVVIILSLAFVALVSIPIWLPKYLLDRKTIPKSPLSLNKKGDRMKKTVGLVIVVIGGLILSGCETISISMLSSNTLLSTRSISAQGSGEPKNTAEGGADIRPDIEVPVK